MPRSVRIINMPWNDEIDLSTKKLTSRLIVEHAIRRGWRIRDFESNPAIFLMYIPGKEQPIKVFSASPSQMSYPAVKIAKDKYITNLILADNNLPVPQEVIAPVSLAQNALSALTFFLDTHHQVVVKPIDASHGKGITMNVTSVDKLTAAIKFASEHTNKTNVIVQQQVTGHDIRAICIDYKYVDAITRVPASVIGDGLHNVSDLIDIANQSSERGENYKARLNVVPKDRAQEFLGDEEMSKVPSEGERVRVIGVSNTGMGGERQNLKNEVPLFLRQIAEKTAKMLELPVCGVDFFVSSLPTLQSTREELNPYIIEVNECPSLVMYEKIDSLDQTNLINCYLDYLAKH